MRKTLINFALLLFAMPAFALPEDGLVYQLKASVVKIRVILPNGHYGVGSGVVVAKDQVVTNCHVVAKAAAINVIKFGESFRASSIKADWQHDICIVRFDGLNTEVAQIGSSKNLQYEQPVFTISFPNNAPKPLATYGFVKALYPMDNSVIIRSTSDFRMGASGGAMFSDDGKLVGIITLKSPGRNAFYYNMPVEWIAEVQNQPEQAIPAIGAPPFWDALEENRPYFMRVVQPYQTEDWPALLSLATRWTEQEPAAIEAWYYRAVAEYKLKNIAEAIKHFNQVLAQNSRHTNALLYLALMDAENGNKEAALAKAKQLDALDVEAANQVKVALGLPAKTEAKDCQTTC
jgi:hypothetical protein